MYPREVWDAVEDTAATNGLDEQDMLELLHTLAEDARRKPPITPEHKERRVTVATYYACDELLMATGPALQEIIQAAHETTAEPKDAIAARLRQLATRGADAEWLREQHAAAERELQKARAIDTWWMLSELGSLRVMDALRPAGA